MKTATTYDTDRATAAELVAIVHQALDVELDAPRLDSATHRACAAFVRALLFDSGESWPELDALRERCAVTINVTPERFRAVPDGGASRPDPRLAVWERAYLAALEQMIRVTSPSDDQALVRCSGIAELMGVIAVRTRAKVAAPGMLDLIQREVETIIAAHAQNDQRGAA